MSNFSKNIEIRRQRTIALRTNIYSHCDMIDSNSRVHKGMPKVRNYITRLEAIKEVCNTGRMLEDAHES